jgi:hypothetical protein
MKRLVLPTTIALGAMTSLAFAGSPVATSDQTRVPVRLSDSQLDQLKAGYSISQRCRGLATCAQNNQSNVFGTNVGGDAVGGLVLVFD